MYVPDWGCYCGTTENCDTLLRRPVGLFDGVDYSGASI